MQLRERKNAWLIGVIGKSEYNRYLISINIGLSFVEWKEAGQIGETAKRGSQIQKTFKYLKLNKSLLLNFNIPSISYYFLSPSGKYLLSRVTRDNHWSDTYYHHVLLTSKSSFILTDQRQVLSHWYCHIGTQLKQWLWSDIQPGSLTSSRFGIQKPLSLGQRSVILLAGI